MIRYSDIYWLNASNVVHCHSNITTGSLQLTHRAQIAELS